VEAGGGPSTIGKRLQTAEGCAGRTEKITLPPVPENPDATGKNRRRRGRGREREWDESIQVRKWIAKLKAARPDICIEIR